MKRSIIIVGAFIVLTVLAAAFWDVRFRRSSIVAGNIRVEQAHFDFNTVSEGTAVQFRCSLTNIGAEPVVIERTSTSCGCTSAIVGEATIAPSQTRYIDIKMNTMGRSGRQTQHVVVHTSDPLASKIVLSLTGVVETKVAVKPRMIDFGEINCEQTAHADIEVIFLTDHVVELTQTHSHHQRLSLSPQGRMVQMRHPDYPSRTVFRQQFRVSLKAGVLAPGAFKSQIDLFTNDPEIPRIGILCRGQVIPIFTTTPSRLHFGLVQPEEKIEQILVVRHHKLNSFKITNIQIDLPGLEITPIKSEIKGEYHLQVQYQAPLIEDAKQRVVTSSVRLETDDPYQPSLEIPVSALVRR